MDKSDLYVKLSESESRYRMASGQVRLLTMKLDAVQQRYEEARKTNCKSYRYNLRLRIVTVEGILNAYNEYLDVKEEEVKDLRYKLYGEVSMEEDDYSGSDEEEDEDV